MSAPKRRRAPAGLSGRALKLWREVVSTYILRPDEYHVLEEACREITLIDRLEEALVDAPLTVPGAKGQPVPNPLITEVRHHRTILGTLLRQLKLPDPNNAFGGHVSRSVQAREAANSRWATAHGYVS